MRVPLLSTGCAVLSLAALPAMAHGWSASDATVVSVQHNCPIVQSSQGSHHVAHPGAYHHARGPGGCPVAAAPAPAHYQYQRVHAPDGVAVVQPAAPDRWRQDRRAWADNNWSGRTGPGCHDANGPAAYRDAYGAPRAAPDGGMRCHDNGMVRERAYAQSSGEFNYTREVDSGWSSSEHAVRIERVVRHDGWGGRPSMTDRYGFLTWPGKTHYINGQPIGPMGAAPDIGPQAPPEESWQVHP